MLPRKTLINNKSLSQNFYLNMCHTLLIINVLCVKVIKGYFLSSYMSERRAYFTTVSIEIYLCFIRCVLF